MTNIFYFKRKHEFPIYLNDLPMKRPFNVLPINLSIFELWGFKWLAQQWPHSDIYFTGIPITILNTMCMTEPTRTFAALANITNNLIDCNIDVALDNIGFILCGLSMKYRIINAVDASISRKSPTQGCRKPRWNNDYKTAKHKTIETILGIFRTISQQCRLYFAIFLT